jgi:toxin FitB
MSYLIDTNVISELVKKNPDEKVIKWFSSIPNEKLFISVITIGELRKGINQILEAQKKEKLRIWLEHELPEWFQERILAIDLAIADRWGRLLAQARRPLPAIDSLIAATALHFDLSVVTRNVADFEYTDLEIINPWEI